MSLAPLSEYFGRSPIYIISYGTFLLFLAGTALVQDLASFLVLRFFSGLFAAVTIANFGGTIADLFPHALTGPAMSIYLWAATCGSPSGFFLFSFVAQRYEWRAIFWTLLAVCGFFWVLMLVTLRETRHTTILRRRAKAGMKATLEAGNRDGHVTDSGSAVGISVPHTPSILAHRSAGSLLNVALARPFRFLFTEAIVIFAALYNGYLYGLSFLFNEAFALVFGSGAGGHGFSTTGVGCAFLGIAAGISIGPLTNIWQERYYHRRLRYYGRGDAHLPEARVQLAKYAALVLPVSIFVFAWTTPTHIHPVVPILASAAWGWAFYTLILMTFQYTEDSYRVYSASALAGIGLVRNIAGAAFPLFGRQLFVRLGYQWGPSLLGFLAVGLVPIPFVLEKYGRGIRKRSPWASEHVGDGDEAEEESGEGEVVDEERPLLSR
jgi:MFS family permease